MHIVPTQGDVFRKDCVSAAVCVVRHCAALPNVAFVRSERPCRLQTCHRQRRAGQRGSWLAIHLPRPVGKCIGDTSKAAEYIVAPPRPRGAIIDVACRR